MTAKPKAKVTEDGYVTSVRDIALLAGVSRRTVTDWVKEPDFPGKTRKGYSIYKIGLWKGNRDATQSQRQQANGASKKTTSSETSRLREIELATAETELRLKQLKLARDAGELVNLVAAKAEVSRMFTRVRTRLEQHPAEAVASLSAEHRPAIIEELRHKTNLLLHEMANFSLDEELE